MESPEKCVKQNPVGPAPDPWVLLLFDPHYRIGCRSINGQILEASAHSSENSDEDPTAAAGRLYGISKTHRIVNLSFGRDNVSLYVGLSDPAIDASLAYHSLNALEKKQAAHSDSISPRLAAAIAALYPHLHQLPYLDLGEHQYIYRFRTAKERNRQVYVDQQSEKLYQSQLCSVVKAARRTRENTSGQPALLDFGPVPSSWPFWVLPRCAKRHRASLRDGRGTPRSARIHAQ